MVLIAAGGLLVYREFAPQGCQTPASPTPARYQAGRVQFGAVTEYCLASPERWANGVAVAPDGSVWFGEEALPGVGHLFPNGTVAEHAWRGANASGGTITGYKSGIWGVALWHEMVWATDEEGNQLVGYSPLNGSFITLGLPKSGSLPYTLTPGPDGALWFTALTQNATLGRVSPGPSLQVSMFPVLGLRDQIPVEVQFANASLGYFVALDPYSGSKGGLYSFDPGNVSNGVKPSRVGAGFPLIFANSLSLSPGKVWVAQHLASNIAEYDLSSHVWTVYPTSTLNFTNTALPYFVRSSGGTVWFNEHYANRIAALDPARGTLTEYSEADPPIASKGDIQNDLTIAEASGKLWFTSTTGNYIGFVDGSSAPDFSISAPGGDGVTLARGGSASVELEVAGSWPSGLRVQVSDSENFTSVPSLISIVPGRSAISGGSGSEPLPVILSVKHGLGAGRYTVGVTVSDGLVYQTAYLFVTVT